MKLELTDRAEEMLESGGEDPFRSLNRGNGMTPERFRSLMEDIDGYVNEFEDRAGIDGASTWRGERLDEADRREERDMLGQHLSGRYFSSYRHDRDTAYILMENYEPRFRDPENPEYVNIVKPSHVAIRTVHEDVHAHLEQTDYREMQRRLGDIVREEVGEKLDRDEIDEHPAAASYRELERKEERLAQRIQNIAANAYCVSRGTPSQRINTPMYVRSAEEMDDRIGLPRRTGDRHLRRRFMGGFGKVLPGMDDTGKVEKAKRLVQSRTEELAREAEKALQEVG
ncbi:MAG: hypothetical protein ABEK01_02370 [Candidatus Nanohaloarchaea archaeon]